MSTQQTAEQIRAALVRLDANFAHPTAETIRSALIQRIDAYCTRVGIKPRTLCERAINDPNFFNKIKNDGNFTVRTYDRLHRYMTLHPDGIGPPAPKPVEPPPPPKPARKSPRTRIKARRPNGGA
jgi:hypothetical protein